MVEARDRAGGRINTVNIEEKRVDLGASWIQGTGPGIYNEANNSWINPIYELAVKYGIDTLKTWGAFDDLSARYYWYRDPEVKLDQARVNDMFKKV